MSQDSDAAQEQGQELDVRAMRKPDKHPTIFSTYAALPVGGAFVLVNDHDPVHLHDEFEADHAGSYGWEYLNREMRDWRIRITKRASTPQPHTLLDTGAIDGLEVDQVTGAAWRLQVHERDLDSAVIALGPEETTEVSNGPEFDMLVHVLAGDGELGTELDTVPLTAGVLLWLPRRSSRRLTAGPDGLRYLTVHQRRRGLLLESS